jgi:hypothetical protein
MDGSAIYTVTANSTTNTKTVRAKNAWGNKVRD